MFHSALLGTKSSNLDLFLCGEEIVKYLLWKNGKGLDLAVLEAVMGMYDGIGFMSAEGSSNQIAMITKTPEVLVVNVSGMSYSLLALLQGYLHQEANNLKGVIFNCCSAVSYPSYKDMVEQKLGLKVYGYFPKEPAISLANRHLGLITAAEVEDLQSRLELAGRMAESCLELDALLELAAEAEQVDVLEPEKLLPITGVKPRIAIARDKAFCFLYADNLHLLEMLGAELVYFSPLEDRELPKEISGLYLCGGYPEEYAVALSKNKQMKQSIKKCYAEKLPIIAECGGFLYLLEQLEDRAGKQYPMVGILKGKSWMTSSLQRFGYLTLEAQQDNLLCRTGQKINAHEFHYSDTNNNGLGFLAKKKQKVWSSIHSNQHLFAGYPHLHWWGNIDFAKNFIKACADFESRT